MKTTILIEQETVEEILNHRDQMAEDWDVSFAYINRIGVLVTAALFARRPIKLYIEEEEERTGVYFNQVGPNPVMAAKAATADKSSDVVDTLSLAHCIYSQIVIPFESGLPIPEQVDHVDYSLCYVPAPWQVFAAGQFVEIDLIQEARTVTGDLTDWPYTADQRTVVNGEELGKALKIAYNNGRSELSQTVEQVADALFRFPFGGAVRVPEGPLGQALKNIFTKGKVVGVKLAGQRVREFLFLHSPEPYHRKIVDCIQQVVKEDPMEHFWQKAD